MDEELTISQVMVMKQVCETKILKAIGDFQLKTGLNVDRIDFADVRPISNRVSYVMEVKLQVRLS